MKSCVGCKHHIDTFGVCSAVDGEGARTETSSFDGITRTYYGIRPSIDAMRAPGGKCGPDATLYAPTLLRRLWAWVKQQSSQGHSE